MSDEGVKAALRLALKGRWDAWQRSTSEAYAAANGVGIDPPDAWVNGLLSYLLEGPGALTPVVARIVAHARAQALRDAAEHLPEVGDVLRGMAAREAQP